jgi:hypothetical protein
MYWTFLYMKGKGGYRSSPSEATTRQRAVEPMETNNERKIANIAWFINN